MAPWSGRASINTYSSDDFRENAVTGGRVILCGDSSIRRDQGIG
jgi:hypothetical protein